MTDIIQQLGFLAGGSRFRRIYERMQLGGDKAYKEADINFKSSWFPVYYVLARQKEPQTVMQITEQIAFSHITVKNIVNELEKEQLVVVAANPGDKRSKLIVLSEEGQQLRKQLEPLWAAFSTVLETVLTSGHPDIINILKRIDGELERSPLNERVRLPKAGQIRVHDYRPELKPLFFELAGYWLTGLLKGKLEEEDEFSLRNPDLAYLQSGGFVFFASYGPEIVACVALRRLDEVNFELCHLFTEPKYRRTGVATKLAERCVSRCKENAATGLWLQANSRIPEACQLFAKLGFAEQAAPRAMKVLKRTEKVMCRALRD